MANLHLVKQNVLPVPSAVTTDVVTPLYVGPDRRADRRRNQTNADFEKLLKNFGLDRRDRIERRQQGGSWLLLSKAVNA